MVNQGMIHAEIKSSTEEVKPLVAKLATELHNAASLSTNIERRAVKL